MAKVFTYIASVAQLFVLSLALNAQQPRVFDRPDPFDADVRTGPEVGRTIPPIHARDQSGNAVDFDGLKGPNGAVILFFRSADW